MDEQHYLKVMHLFCSRRKRKFPTLFSPCTAVAQLRPSTLKQISPLFSFVLPEAHHGTLFTDVTSGLVFGRFCGGDSVKYRQPHHGLRLQMHPVHELLQLDDIITAHLKPTSTDKPLIHYCNALHNGAV